MAYITSDLYKEAINNEAKTTFIDGTLTTIGGETIQLSNDMLTTGGLYVTNQCVNNDAFDYGSVFAAELGITLQTEIDRYTLYDAEIKPSFNILLSNGEYEKIPLGVFYINEPNRVGRNVSIKAYDKMVNLEEAVTESFEGEPYDLLLFISTRCNVPLAQTRTMIRALVNGSMLLSVNPSLVKTYRELLSYVCKATCTFASINREGSLQLYEFSTEVSKEISARTKTSSKFSDFETHFSGASASFIYSDSYKTYTQVNNDQGLIYDLGKVPIVRGLDATNQGAIANISLKTSFVNYTPCDISFTGDPSIDLGDMIKNVDRHGNEYYSLVTFYKWAYRGNHQIKSAGQNPKLARAKGQSAKDIENLQNDMSTKDIAVYTYTNSGNVTFEGGNSADVTSMNSIVTISFATKKAATCVAMITIPLEITEESDVEFHQLFDGIEMQSGLVAQRCHKGKSTVSFVNYFTTKENSIHRYSIVGITKGVDGGAAGKLSVTPYSLRAIIFGQGLSSTVQWDGTIIVSDEISPIEINAKRIGIVNFNDEAVMSRKNYNPHEVSDVIGVVEVVGNEIAISGFTEQMNMTR